MNVSEQTVIIKKSELHCLTQHFGAFHEQFLHNQIADFTEPCVKCKLRESCKCEWLKLLGLFELGQIKVCQ